MADKKFEAIMTLLVPQVVQLICENDSVDEVTASRAFYESKVYALLEQEETKLWHFSPLTLFHMYAEEKKNGRFRDSGGGVGMSRQGDFLIYCVETYKNAKHLTGRQVAELFTRYRVWDYVYSCFEALHTTGANYIVEDIDLYIKARQPATT